MIEAHALKFQYPGSEEGFALRGISFTLKAGERVALMGANGSGKTTFVRCLNGLLKPFSGDVLVDGLSVHKDQFLHEIRRRVGMVFQNPDNQIVTTSVLREIAFGLENLGLEPEKMKGQVQEALERFNLEEYRDAPPHLLSGGERQRLALASVWVMKPRYLILDEPTSLLDPRGRREVLRLIKREIEKRHVGVLLVTQYPEEALGFDRLVVMHQGRVLLDGSPEHVFQHVEKLRRTGVGVPVNVELTAYAIGRRYAHFR